MSYVYQYGNQQTTTTFRTTSGDAQRLRLAYGKG